MEENVTMKTEKWMWNAATSSKQVLDTQSQALNAPSRVKSAPLRRRRPVHDTTRAHFPSGGSEAWGVLPAEQAADSHSNRKEKSLQTPPVVLVGADREAITSDYPPPPPSPREGEKSHPLVFKQKLSALQMVQQSDRGFRRPLSSFSMRSEGDRRPAHVFSQRGSNTRPMTAHVLRSQAWRDSEKVKIHLAARGIAVPRGVIERALTAPHVPIAEADRPSLLPNSWSRYVSCMFLVCFGTNLYVYV